MKAVKAALMVALVFSLALWLALVVACGDDDDDDADDDTDDDDAGEEVWEDSISGLMWQVEPTGGEMNGEEAMEHCEDLSLGGYSDWRLPTISELRSLIRGCPATETGGACGVTDSCKEDDCCNDSCIGCDNGSGPGLDGDYWPVELTGDCPEEGNCSGYWSSVGILNGIDMDSWLVGFRRAKVCHTSRAWINYVRCVR